VSWRWIYGFWGIGRKKSGAACLQGERQGKAEQYAQLAKNRLPMSEAHRAELGADQPSSVPRGKWATPTRPPIPLQTGRARPLGQ